MKSPQTIDTCDIDFRPRTRRSNGGISFPALSWHGDMGSPESSSASTTTNQQVTVQGGATGSTTTSVGASSAAGQYAGNISNSAGAMVYSGQNNNINVTTTSLDPEVAAAAIQNSANVAGYAIQAQGQTAANALQFGAEAVTQSNQTAQFAIAAEGTTATNAFISNQNTVNTAFGFGAEALNDVATVAEQSEQSANQTTSDLAATLDHIAENSTGTPATATVANPVQSVNSPASSAGGLSNLVWLAVGIGSLYVIWKTGGKSS